jgi:hypothetical protein
VPDPYRIVTCPTPAVGPLRVATATGLVSIDALLRRARAEGRRTEWAAAALGGDSFALGAPADAIPVLEATLEGGATAGQAERLRALVSPLSGG